ncbi:MAG: hypothetical protein ACYDBA_13510, partial [Sulfuricaulis sp.]
EKQFWNEIKDQQHNYKADEEADYEPYSVTPLAFLLDITLMQPKGSHDSQHHQGEYHGFGKDQADRCPMA